MVAPADDYGALIAGGGEGTDRRTLFFARATHTTTENDIKALFSTFGHVEAVKCFRPNPGCAALPGTAAGGFSTRGCGLVKMSCGREAEAAIAALHETFTWAGMSSPMIVRYMEPDCQHRKRNPQSGRPGSRGAGRSWAAHARASLPPGGGGGVAMTFLRALMEPVEPPPQQQPQQQPAQQRQQLQQQQPPPPARASPRALAAAAAAAAAQPPPPPPPRRSGDGGAGSSASSSSGSGPLYEICAPLAPAWAAADAGAAVAGPLPTVARLAPIAAAAAAPRAFFYEEAPQQLQMQLQQLQVQQQVQHQQQFTQVQQVQQQQRGCAPDGLLLGPLAPARSQPLPTVFGAATAAAAIAASPAPPPAPQLFAGAALAAAPPPHGALQWAVAPQLPAGCYTSTAAAASGPTFLVPYSLQASGGAAGGGGAGVQLQGSPQGLPGMRIQGLVLADAAWAPPGSPCGAYYACPPLQHVP